MSDMKDLGLGKIEHIGIAVKDLKAAEQVYTKLLGCKPYKCEAVASEHVITSFFQAGPNKIELIQATEPHSAIAKHIDKRGEGLHHMAFAVNDIAAEMARLREAGFQVLSEKPKLGADNMLVAFIHPKSTGGVLVELCQKQS